MHAQPLGLDDDTPQPLNVPRIYNLITDPKEDYQVQDESTWVLPVMFSKIVAFQATLAQELPIPMGTLDPYPPPE